ncbi:MAG: caspase family protein [Pseudomonadota bacterium]
MSHVSRQCCLWLLGAAVALVQQLAFANAEPRLALLIGNSSYKASPLANPVNDVRLMEGALKESGFTVIKAENASIREMRRLVRDFGDRLKASGGVGLFYFAGHGVQVRGENFLISTDSDIRNEDEVADDSLNANVILEKMQSAGNRVNLIVLDACRNNPFSVKSRSATSGLANMSAPSGSLVAYSTAPGSVASDGKGRNGLYTEHLAKVIRQPGLPVEEVFKQVRAAVRRESNNQQTPWENTALEGQFFFKAPVQVAGPAPAMVAPRPEGPDPVALEMSLWDNVKTATTAGELQAYLNRYPSGFFADVAKARMAAMGSLASDKATAQKVAYGRTSVDANLKAVGVSPGATVASGVIGTLVMKDTLTGLKSNLDVTVQESDAEKTVYSSGDVIARDGKVQQVRIGSVVVRALSDPLWTLPIKAGAEGEVKIERTDMSVRSHGVLKWKAVAAGDGKMKIESRVWYPAIGAGSGVCIVAGKWAAIYDGEHALPESFFVELRGGGGCRDVFNMASAELQFQ